MLSVETMSTVLFTLAVLPSLLLVEAASTSGFVLSAVGHAAYLMRHRLSSTATQPAYLRCRLGSRVWLSHALCIHRSRRTCVDALCCDATGVSLACACEIEHLHGKSSLLLCFAYTMLSCVCVCVRDFFEHLHGGKAGFDVL